MATEIRRAEDADVPAMTAIRARYSYDAVYWAARIGGYLNGTHSPQKALTERAAFLAIEGEEVIGFVAGHRTTRFECDGELEWIDVVPERRGAVIAGRLIAEMAAWFVEQEAYRVCVNVAPENVAAVRLYARHGAKPLTQYFMVWDEIRIELTRDQGMV